jgi:glycosyltransferase involved in cell wall biosynthesis
MNIAIFWESSDWGGSDSHLLELLSNWKGDEDELTLIYNHGNPGYERIRSEIDKLNMKSFPIRIFSYSSLLTIFRSTSGYSLIRILLYFIKPILFFAAQLQIFILFSRLGKFDILLAINGGYPAAWGTLSALPAAKRAKIPVRILLVHHSATRPGAMMSIFERYVDHVVMSTATAIVCVSRATRNLLIKNRHILPERVPLRVIYNNYIFHSKREPEQEVIEIFSGVRTNNDEILIGMMGRIEPYKGHEDLIYGLARLPPEKIKRFRIVFIGSGQSNEIMRLKNIATYFDVLDRVEFLGYLKYSSFNIANELDILAMLTRSFEGFGLTILEAMSVGTPIIATRVGAVTEFVNDSNGYLVNPSSPNEVFIALEDFLENPKKWQKRIKNALDKLNHKSSSMQSEYFQLTRELTAEKSFNN